MSANELMEVCIGSCVGGSCVGGSCVCVSDGSGGGVGTLGHVFLCVGVCWWWWFWFAVLIFFVGYIEKFYY